MKRGIYLIFGFVVMVASTFVNLAMTGSSGTSSQGWSSGSSSGGSSGSGWSSGGFHK
jgi:uncharacterized membrane protein YgcG